MRTRAACGSLRGASRCRWCLTETREPVAAKLVDVPRCARRETKALQLAKAAKVPRVVQLIDVVADEPNTWLILEYVLTFTAGLVWEQPSSHHRYTLPCYAVNLSPVVA